MNMQHDALNSNQGAEIINMLIQIIESLTKEQKADLYLRDIPPQLVSAWKTGRRRPTYAQCIRLADVTGTDAKELLFQVALHDVTPEERKKFLHK